MNNMYKIGDKIRIKSRAWYEHNKNEEGKIEFEKDSFVPQMAKYCGKEAIILKIKYNSTYSINLDDGFDWSWTDEMLESPESVESSGSTESIDETKTL